MIRSRFVRTFGLVLTAAFAISCADNSPTGPAAPLQAKDGLLGDLVGALKPLAPDLIGFVADATGLTVHPVKWSASRPAVPYSVSATIGRSGGTLSIPEADFTITFPYGAVSQPTPITITSDPKFVAYTMSPHGTRFARPVTITQRLKNTEVFGSPLNSHLFGAYLAGDDLLDLSNILHALEIETSLTIFSPGPSNTPIPDTEVWIINHFSRYMLASG
jgi:hypothetical protein